MKTAELWNCDNLSDLQRLSREQTLLAEAQVGSRFVVVAEIESLGAPRAARDPNCAGASSADDRRCWALNKQIAGELGTSEFDHQSSPGPCNAQHAGGLIGRPRTDGRETWDLSGVSGRVLPK